MRDIVRDLHETTGSSINKPNDLFDYTIELLCGAESTTALEFRIREAVSMKLNNETLSSLVVTGTSGTRPFTIYYICIPSLHFEVYKFDWPRNSGPYST